MLELFVYSYMIWMLPLLVAFCIISWAVEQETEGGQLAAAVVIAYVVYTYFFSKDTFNVIRDFVINVNFIWYVLLYLIIGVVWSIIKLKIFLSKKTYLSYEPFITIDNAVEHYLKSNKDLLIKWISYWPISIIATFISDIIRNFWNKLVDSFSSIYKAIIKSHFNKINSK